MKILFYSLLEFECIDLYFIDYGRLINYTCIDSLFGGHLLSTVLCEECKTCSQNIEPFLDLSLPIVDDKTVINGNLLNTSGIPII
jgi:ubiquitin carboxyl-terminal hydrolase 16/45